MLFSFVSTLLIFNDPGWNESTFTGLLIFCSLLLVGRSVLKRAGRKHGKDRMVFVFVIVPAIASLVGLVIALK